MFFVKLMHGLRILNLIALQPGPFGLLGTQDTNCSRGALQTGIETYVIEKGQGTSTAASPVGKEICRQRALDMENPWFYPGIICKLKLSQCLYWFTDRSNWILAVPLLISSFFLQVSTPSQSVAAKVGSNMFRDLGCHSVSWVTGVYSENIFPKAL